MNSSKPSVEDPAVNKLSVEEHLGSMNRPDVLPERRPLIRWLTVIGILILLMVSVGGITRLTESGLSMVDWRPLMGTIPPLDEAEWQKVFSAYQQFPEYQQINHRMTLHEFKKIFFWEYIHRLLGRVVGVVFLLPWVYFMWRKRIPPGYNLRFAALFGLGAAQGLMGWYMVKSGLVDIPNVSHFRLAAHLALAFTTLGLAFWYILRLRDTSGAPKGPTPVALRKLGLAFTALVALQILYGAFTAGLDAGFGHNTFPLMSGELVPRGMWLIDPAWLNVFENNIAVQFIHRTLGWLVCFSALGLLAFTRKRSMSADAGRAVRNITLLALVQFGLGVATLLSVVAIPLAVAHQLGAAALLLAALKLNYLTVRS